ncbi:MAG: chemotaxis protein CheD [Terracidiphilus sp.]
MYNLRIKSDFAAEVASSGPEQGLTHPTPRHRMHVHIGDVAASRSPAIIDTLLGSCVAVCMYDPVLRSGGMNHILLPKCREGDKSPRYGIHAMELLINELMKLGGDRRRFVAKAFGGGNVMNGLKMRSIGDWNAKFVREFLALERIPLVSERLGGNHAVHLYFRTDTGKATVHTVDGSILPKIVAEEGSYWKPPSPGRSYSGEITLF